MATFKELYHRLVCEGMIVDHSSPCINCDSARILDIFLLSDIGNTSVLFITELNISCNFVVDILVRVRDGKLYRE
ncbi:unnamed protein product [Rotaria sordida]|uniref:Uncharacterized protein n=1 Tax=Rotaria sordida TaxID=392033 RepID=A0A816DKL8_9BILA|nr:unnamed protein product [Rotaria sordida]CAF1472536.1 unnamed protein product [Rotaria sordida]CAF1639817.1 unnamed protein product [Rotaria sordida]CAF4232200.1 unnamed protein product [Rotaria sordida]